MSGQGRLEVNGPHEFSQIRVFDASRAEVASAVGRLDQPLDAGVYYVQSLVPGMKQERIVAVEPDATAVVGDFAPDFDSVAPLAQARSTHEYHTDPAVRLSNTPHAVHPGATSRAFFFGRVQDTQQTAGFTPVRFALRMLDGGLMGSSDEIGETDPAWGWQAVTIDVPAGTYMIHEEIEGVGPRAQALYAAPGWETQVFFDARDPNRFANASVFMQRKGAGFGPMSQADYSRVEAALDGLAAGEITLARYDIDALLYGKFDNPMLGLIGAYAYLESTRRSGAQVDYGSLFNVSFNLEGLIGMCPDVAVLRAVAESKGAEDYDPWGFAITEPPMLAAATKIALRLAAHGEGIAPKGSPFFAVSGRLTSGSAWTRWDLDATDDDVASGLMPAISQMLDADASMTPMQLARALAVPRSLVDGYLASQDETPA